MLSLHSLPCALWWGLLIFVVVVPFGQEEEFVRRPRRKNEAEKEEEAGEEEDVVAVEVVDVVVREGKKACRQVRLLRRNPSTCELIGACLRVRLR